MVSTKHAIEQGMNTNAPQMLWMAGNSIPTMKLQPQEEMLPKAMAAGRGPSSNSSDPMKKGMGPIPTWYTTM